MALNRRQFLRAVTAGLAAAALPVCRAAERLLPAGAGENAFPRRVLRALEARCYPGPVRPLDERAVRRPGRWAG